MSKHFTSHPQASIRDLDDRLDALEGAGSFIRYRTI